MSDSSVLNEALNTPMGEILRSVAAAVADAQMDLDRSAVAVAELMSGRRVLRDPETGEAVDAEGQATDTPVVIDSRLDLGYERHPDGTVQPTRWSALELGFTPTFYQFAETLIELKIALRLSRDVNQRTIATGTAVDGAYASKYGFETQYASTFRARLVPVPPPASLGVEPPPEPVADLAAEGETA